MTHDYSEEYYALHDAGMEWDEASTMFIARFEAEAAEYLKGTRAEDVGAVICYYDANGEEAAYFDYENMWGNVYALNPVRGYEVGLV